MDYIFLILLIIPSSDGLLEFFQNLPKFEKFLKLSEFQAEPQYKRCETLFTITLIIIIYYSNQLSGLNNYIITLNYDLYIP